MEVDLHDLETLIKSRVRIITLDSSEETRVVDLFIALGGRLDTPVFTWTVTDGLHRRNSEYSPQSHTRRPLDALGQIKGARRAGIYLFLDFEPYFDDIINRHLKELCQDPSKPRHTLVFVGTEFELPAPLKTFAAAFSLAKPDDDKLHEIVRHEARIYRETHGGNRVRTTPAFLDKLVQNLRGLTTQDARQLAHRAIFDDGAITEDDLAATARAKFKLLDGDQLLSLDFETAHFQDIGGLRKLKQWLDIRRPAFLEGEAADRPKGVMLVGVQGCGKSLAAKTVAGAWGVPLLGLDFGRLYNKYHGETERNLRSALATATAMAPCVLWIDEIEKAISVGDSDSGTSQRVLGTLLTWMNEDKPAVFLVATANAIEALPPELIRKGRMDEIFFVDLPKPDVRAHILEIHLARRGVHLDDADMAQLVEASEGFSGSELEQAVVSGIYVAKANKTTLTAPDVLAEMGRTQPLSVVMAERIAGLRAWAAGRTVPVD